MSAEATFWAWMMGVKPSPCKLVLLCMADCHNGDNGRCDPSTAYITAFTGLDRKTVMKAIAALKEMGLITTVKRPGNSTQYHLCIPEHPVPVREKGARKKPVPVSALSKEKQYQIRDYPNTGLPEISTESSPASGSTGYGSTKNGTTEYGTTTSPKYGTTGSPKYGTAVVPNMGHEPTKNLPVEPTSEPTSSDADASATGAANSVDNFKSIQVDYQSPSADQLIFNRGAEFLGRYKIPDEAARKFLGMCKSKFGLGRTLDAVVVSIFSQPARDPKAFVLGVLANQPRPIDQTWGPSDATVSELEGLGMPPDLIKNARGVFVTWFSDMEIQHSDWPRLFKDWVIRDWERAEFKKHQYRTILAASAGLEYGTPFCEPPGGTL